MKGQREVRNAPADIVCMLAGINAEPLECKALVPHRLGMRIAQPGAYTVATAAGVQAQGMQVRFDFRDGRLGFHAEALCDKGMCLVVEMRGM